MWSFFNKGRQFSFLNTSIFSVVFGILRKWYIMIFGVSIIVTYWVFQGLQSSGVITSIDDTLTDSFFQIKSVAQNCTPKIKDFYSFWECVQKPPKYVPDERDKTIEKNLNNMLNNGNNGEIQIKNPYE